MGHRAGPSRVRYLFSVIALLALVLGGSGLITSTAAGAAPGSSATPPPPGPATLTVTITDVAGEPLGDAALSVRRGDLNGEWWSVEARTDATGRAVITGLPVGEAVVEMPSSVFSRQYPTTLAAGSNPLAIDLSEHAELTGRVTGLPSGEDGWEVCLSDEDTWPTCTPLDSDGRYAFVGVDAAPAGDYRLRISRWSGEGGTAGSTTISLAAGRRVVKDIDLSRRDARVSGTVIGADGVPTSGRVEVRAYSDELGDDEILAADDLDSTGRFQLSIDQVRPGMRLVVIDSDNLAIHEDELFVLGGDDVTHDVYIGGRHRGTVTGTIRDEDGDPVVDASVWVCRGYDCDTVFTGADGKYARTNLSAGPVKVLATAGGYLADGVFSGTLEQDGTLVADLSMRQMRPLPGGITIGGMQPTDPPTRTPRLSRLYASTMTMQACRGGTVTWTMVTSSGGASASGQLVESGTTPGAFDGMIPPPPSGATSGRVTVSVSCPDGSSSQESFDVEYIDPSGTVLDTDGQPVEGATVTLEHARSADGPFVAVPEGSQLMSPDNRVNPWTTGASGGFRWDVAAGFYRLRVSAPGYHVPGTDENLLTTEVWEIPPEVVGLELVLEKDAEEPAPESDPSITLTAAPRHARVGHSLTLRTRVGGEHGPATGTVDFTRAGEELSECQDVPLRHGRATCRSSVRAAGTSTYGVTYAGASPYAAGSADVTVRAAKGWQRTRIGRLGASRPGQTVQVRLTRVGSGTPVVVTDLTSSVCRTTVTRSGLDVRTMRDGQCRFRIARAEDANWSAATPLVAGFEVTTARRGTRVAGYLESTSTEATRMPRGASISAGRSRSVVTATFTSRATSPAGRVRSVRGGGLHWVRVTATTRAGVSTQVWQARSRGPVRDLVVVGFADRALRSPTVAVTVSEPVTR